MTFTFLKNPHFISDSPLTPEQPEQVKFVKAKRTPVSSMDPTGGLHTIQETPKSKEHFVK